MRVDFEALFSTAASLAAIGNLPDHETGDRLVAFLRALVPFDYSVVFAYFENLRPIDLYSTFDPLEYKVFVSLYQDGAYLLDPFYRAATMPRPGIWRMRELAPDRFFASEYYRNYYIQTGLSEEIGYFVRLDDGATVVMSLMRSEKAGPFKPAEYEMLKKALPFVECQIKMHWKDTASRFARGAANIEKRMREGAEKPGMQNLTSRERAIIELVLQGHSSESIGLTLGVATGTVKVHRRNIYRKLGISSQTQLMSLYLASLKT